MIKSIWNALSDYRMSYAASGSNAAVMAISLASGEYVIAAFTLGVFALTLITAIKNDPS